MWQIGSMTLSPSNGSHISSEQTSLYMMYYRLLRGLATFTPASASLTSRIVHSPLSTMRERRTEFRSKISSLQQRDLRPLRRIPDVLPRHQVTTIWWETCIGLGIIFNAYKEPDVSAKDLPLSTDLFADSHTPMSMAFKNTGSPDRLSSSSSTT